MAIQILRHTPGNTLGELESLLAVHGLPYEYLEVHALEGPALAASLSLQPAMDGLIILGGFESVTEEDQYPFMPWEQQLIRDAVAAGLPVFGICLGAQMMARSLGAAVRRNPVKEIGWTPIVLSPEGQDDAVLSALHDQAQFQWHEDTYACPPGAVHLAASALCAEQAFRVNNRTYGVQFHPEVTRDTIERWLGESRSLPDAERERIQTETETCFDRCRAASQAMFTRYLKQAYGV